MMMFSNSAGSVSRPRVVTAKDCCTSRPVGAWPTRPTAYCWFWAATAVCTSAAVTPSSAMRSGLSQMRMA
jgi:hypothetical protein